MGRLDFLQRELDLLREKNLYRILRTVEGEQLPRTIVNGKEMVLMASNNYLGLASHPYLKEAAIKSVEKYGVSASASRLISGTMTLHRKLEEKIASFKKTESALVFNSGYTANIGIISTLLTKGDIIFSDELNHASIIDGCRLSGAEIMVFPHKRTDILERMIKRSHTHGKRMIVVDAVFSMDGDIAPLPEIVYLAEKYDCILMVDEAHATGILGERGSGAVEHFHLEGRVDIIMGTLSKALGGFGAYCAGRRELIEYLINRSRPFIFTTALPPAVISTAIAAIELIEKEPSLRENLWSNTRYFKDGLERMGFDTMGTETPIIPVFVGSERNAVIATEILLEEGVFALGIRPPTVPAGKCRIRATVMANHTIEDLNRALKAFEKAGKTLGLI